MLTLKLFDPNQPLDCKTITLNHENNDFREYLIGNNEQCQIKLNHHGITPIVGKIQYTHNQYTFINLHSQDQIQLNDDLIEQNQSYPLENNDLIRIKNYILIITQVSTPENGESSVKSRKTKKKSGQSLSDGLTSNNSPSRLKTLKNRLEKRRSQTNTEIEEISQNSSDLQIISADNSLNSLPLPPIGLFSPQMDILSEETVKSKLNHLNWWTEKEIKVICTAIFNETHDVKTFRFIANPPLLFDYQPGQFVTLHLTIDEKPVKRSYSISSSPSRPYHLDITVKRVPTPENLPNVPPGLVSNWLHDNVKVGNSLTLSGPFGKFTCIGKNNPKLLFISAGSGITPMISMSRWILETGMTRDIVFFHSGRRKEDLIYPQELTLMSRQFPNFKLFFSLTRLKPEEKWQGLRGRLDKNILQEISPDFLEREVYVCGPNEFMGGVKSLLESLNFPMQNYYSESFGVGKSVKSSQKEALSGNNSFEIVFNSSGQTITTDGSTSLLELAEEAGINLECSCRSGVCGMCKVIKIEGEIDYQSEAEGLTKEDAERGYILTCIAYPKGKVTLNL